MSAAPVLVLLHGFTGGPSSWDEVVAALPVGPRVLRETLCGHGARELDTAEDFAEEVDRLAARLRQAGVERAHLCGYSLGARVGLGLLVRHGALFGGATLVGGSAGLATDEERRERARIEEGWMALLREGIEPFVTMWERLPLFATQRRGTALAAQRATRLLHRPEGLIRSLEVLGLARMPDLAPQLGGLAAPVELVTGALDDKFTRIARELVLRVPRARHHVVEGVGHNVPLEAPGALAERIRMAMEERA